MSLTIRAAALLAAALVLGLPGVARAAAPTSPIKPLSSVAPVRAGFLDVRCAPETPDGTCPAADEHWHSGADVVVNRDACSVQAPVGGCRRVYAMRSGTVFVRYGRAATYCGAVRAGLVGYGHVMPRVHVGQRLRAGQFLGWSCRAQEHVHISNFAQAPCHTGGLGNPAWPQCLDEDPLRLGGGTLYDPADTLGPTIQPVLEDGYVDADIDDARDPGWLIGPYAHLYNALPPARVDVNGVTLIDAAWKADGHGMVPVTTVYAPEASRNAKAGICALLPSTDACAGSYTFRLAPANPGVPVVVQAWDSAGNETTITVTP